MERLDFDLSFRWFVGLGIDDAVWDHSTFSKNRDRVLDGDVAAGFFIFVEICESSMFVALSFFDRPKPRDVALPEPIATTPALGGFAPS